MAPNGALRFKEKDAHLSPGLPSQWRPLRVSRVKCSLVIAWLLLLWWGERMAFSSHISSCNWKTWEQWVGLAPHICTDGHADRPVANPH